MYIEFNTKQSWKNKFNIRIENPLAFGFQVQIDLLAGKYKLLNLNDTFVDSIVGNQTLLYESFGHKGRFWFFEMKMCYGEADVQFYKDYQSFAAKKDPLERKKVNENNTFVYYLTLQNSNVYIDVSNKNSDQSIYKISAYNEQDLNDNPYQEVLAQSAGTVKVDTSESQISFDPIYMRNFTDDSYDHKVTYFLYLSPQFKVMRYSKNCGKHLITKAFSNPELISNKVQFLFEGSH